MKIVGSVGSLFGQEDRYKPFDFSALEDSLLVQTEDTYAGSDLEDEEREASFRRQEDTETDLGRHEDEVEVADISTQEDTGLDLATDCNTRDQQNNGSAERGT